jgi:sulfate adenylyltransferase large subunit
MNAPLNPAEFTFERFVQQQERKSLLRFVACGSVDHGKSTLIGRLLYESNVLFEDQRVALEADSRKYGTQDNELDYSLLLDGLAAEREQKITIDIAYRFFSTDRRKFIVIDAPGHEQYTPNMATGASMADAALILVDARAGITRQTKRHTLIVSTLGVRHIVLAVNKMDLVDWSQRCFAAVEREFRELATDLGVTDVVCIPLAAKSGDNVVERSTRMAWYAGPTLLDYLENVEIGRPTDRDRFRMPVQWINRPNPDFRGLSGLITGGEVYRGMPVRILPSGRASRIDRIATFDGDLERAGAGLSVTLTLVDEIDVSRGDVVTGMNDAPEIVSSFSARVFWMGKDVLAPDRGYLIKLATATAVAKIAVGLNVVDLDTRGTIAADVLAPNEVGVCTLTLDRAVAVDRYVDARETGSFILIDPETYDTVGMGCVEATTDRGRSNVTRFVPSFVPDFVPAFIRSWTPLQHNAASVVAHWTSTRTRSLAKAVIWGAAASLITFALVYAVTRNLNVAALITAAEVMIKTLFYYFYERVWMTIRWGKR